MTASTFSHTDHTPSHALQSLRDFLIAWVRATPAYLFYRAVTH